MKLSSAIAGTFIQASADTALASCTAISIGTPFDVPKNAFVGMGRSVHDDSELLLVRNQSIKRRARKFRMSRRKVGLNICPSFSAASLAAATTLMLRK